MIQLKYASIQNLFRYSTNSDGHFVLGMPNKEVVWNLFRNCLKGSTVDVGVEIVIFLPIKISSADISIRWSWSRPKYPARLRQKIKKTATKALKWRSRSGTSSCQISSVARLGNSFMILASNFLTIIAKLFSAILTRLVNLFWLVDSENS